MKRSTHHSVEKSLLFDAAFAKILEIVTRQRPQGPERCGGVVTNEGAEIYKIKLNPNALRGFP